MKRARRGRKQDPIPPLATPIVEVVWLDAMLQSDGNYVTNPEDLANEEPGTINRSVGFLLRQDDECVKIAMEATHNGEGYRDVLTVPTSLIKKVKKLR